MMNFAPALYIISTPIGNLEDFTIRSINVLIKSNLILCEDTRRSIKLLNHYKIKNKLISYHKFNERSRVDDVIKRIKSGQIIALISDAGTPTISDPGRILCEECIKNNINIIPLPGPSAITAAISASGFSDQFYFHGFINKQTKKAEKEFKTLSKIESSIVVFVNPKKINSHIEYIKKYFGGRKILIAREISKYNETFYRYTVNDLDYFKEELLGEITIVISEKISNEKVITDKELEKEIRLLSKRLSSKDIVNKISKKYKFSKKKIYDICLKYKK